MYYMFLNKNFQNTFLILFKSFVKVFINNFKLYYQKNLIYSLLKFLLFLILLNFKKIIFLKI